jgi:capsular polysaccharide transport system permease protein
MHAGVKLPLKSPRLGGMGGGKRRRQGAGQPIIVQPMASAADVRPRHRWILVSLLLLVLLPAALSAAYLWVFAKDQFASTVGFSVRKEEISSSMDLLGGITKLTGSSTTDTDVLYDYILSQELVAEIDAELGLRAMFSRAWPNDPVFGYNPDGSIEDLVSHWERKVTVLYDTGTGLITLRVLAFDPNDARAIAEAIFAHSSQMINELSAIAREDATRYAREELDRALERLKVARQELTSFRLRTKIIDPQADLQGQMGVLNTLQGQLAETLIELDLLRENVRDTDPRITQAERRIEVIQNRIADERLKFGEGGQGPGGADYATLVADFERLTVDREFAEETYRSAFAAYDSALSEAQRQSRYLAPHIKPTLAERSVYPHRWVLLGMTTFFLIAAWSIGVLVYYSVRDRR